MQALQPPVLEFVTLRPLGGATTTCITMGSIADGFLIKYTSLLLLLMLLPFYFFPYVYQLCYCLFYVDCCTCVPTCFNLVYVTMECEYSNRPYIDSCIPNSTFCIKMVSVVMCHWL